MGINFCECYHVKYFALPDFHEFDKKNEIAKLWQKFFTLKYKNLRITKRK